MNTKGESVDAGSWKYRILRFLECIPERDMYLLELRGYKRKPRCKEHKSVRRKLYTIGAEHGFKVIGNGCEIRQITPLKAGDFLNQDNCSGFMPYHEAKTMYIRRLSINKKEGL